MSYVQDDIEALRKAVYAHKWDEAREILRRVENQWRIEYGGEAPTEEMTRMVDIMRGGEE